MNFLAHSFLSFADPLVMMGNLAGDMLNNRHLPGLDPRVRAGVFYHRKIDSFTDNHPIIRISNLSLYPEFGKYAPVVVDIFTDYLLSKNWHLFTEETLTGHYRRVYDTIKENKSVLPQEAGSRLASMAHHKWLEQYESYQGLSMVFVRLSRRARFENNFLQATQVLKFHEKELEKNFLLFFPTVIEAAKKYYSSISIP